MYMNLTQSPSLMLARPTYAIRATLGRAYCGTGWVLAAIVRGQVVHLRYLCQLSPALAQALDEDLTDSLGTALVRQWLRSDEAQPHIREMQALGDVSAGLCTGRTFCPL